VLGAAGCAPPVLSLSADAEPARVPYLKTLDRWSRVGRIVSVEDLDTPVVVTATLRSRAFQHAFADRYIESYKITDPTERDRIYERERAATDSGLSFWVWTSFHNYQWNDFRPVAGKWRLALVDEAGQSVEASAVDQLTTRDLSQPVLLGAPLDRYSKLWLVRFPAQRSDGQPVVPATAKKIILRAAGPLGQTELTWLLQ
jgi:hypothetical protein